MKVWMWQRLWKFNKGNHVFSEYSDIDVNPCLHVTAGIGDAKWQWHWLCPKPQLVLVDRKHLGGMK